MGRTEIALNQAKVYVNNVAVTDLHCLSVERSVGINPGRAMLLQTFGQDVVGPVAMRLPAGLGYSYGQRVTITTVANSVEASTPIFNGFLLKRSDQGASDKVIWQALDDRVLMQWIALRGCLIFDPVDSVLRFSPRHPLVFNPNGFWNCTGYDYDGTTWPVFTITSRKVQAYEAPNTAVGLTTLTQGKYSPWTPRRALLYLQLMANLHQLGGTGIPGLDGTPYTSLDVDGPLQFRTDEINAMHGYDPVTGAGATDPLDRKLNTMSLQGISLLAGITRILDAAGTHSMHVQPRPDTNKFRSLVSYQLTGYAPSNGMGEEVRIQRSGVVGDTRGSGVLPNCYDYHFDEDASQLAQTVMVEGDVIRAETSLLFANPGSGTDYYDDTASDIIPAWTKAQEAAFLECIHGGAYTSPADAYAKRAVYSGSTTLEVCDGSTGRPLIWARSREALEAARESFPTVFRAWKLNGRTDNMQALLGVPLDNGSGGLKDGRPLLPEQLQFFSNPFKTGIESWMIMNLPIRIRLYEPFTGKWYEVPRDLGLRTTGDGLIWLDGIAEGANGTDYSCFIGDLMNEDDFRAQRIKLRDIKINAALPTDQRVMGLSTTLDSSGLSPYPYLDDYILSSFETGSAKLLRYQDSGATYKRHFQVNSEPSNNAGYYGGTNGTTPYDPNDGDVHDVPPGSEEVHANYEAQRTLARFINPHRQATFSMIGIQPEWLPGVRISYVTLMDPAGTMGGDVQYFYAGCIGTVTHDFLAQTTTLGGLIGEYGCPTMGGA